VLGLDIGPIEHVPRARMPDKVPVVLSREEIGRLITHVDGTMWLIVALLYGTGLRLEECVELRVKDLDFDRNQIVVRRGKGQKDRVTMLPAAVKERLAAHLLTARELSHFSSQRRDASARGRLRHPDGAGTARSCRRVDNDDLCGGRRYVAASAEGVDSRWAISLPRPHK
jgi:integrase